MNMKFWKVMKGKDEATEVEITFLEKKLESKIC
jgi:hypothetical protein